MKTINNYIQDKLVNHDIQERLVINSKSKQIGDLDKLNDDDKVLYDSTQIDDEDEAEILWEECKAEFNKIDDDHFGFIAYKDISIMDAQYSKYASEPEQYDKVLFELIEEIVTGRDQGYRVKLVGGHIEIDCINSGSTLTWYIYAISEKAYYNIDDYMSGVTSEIQNLDFLYEDNDRQYVQCIELK